MREALQSVVSDWGRLGILFNVPLAERTPDIEPLLIRTAEVLPNHARLLPAVTTWLGHYERMVARHRLAAIAGRIERRDVSASLGLLLDLGARISQTDHLSSAIAACRAAATPGPLFLVDRRSEAMSRLARDSACDIALRWGLWTPRPATKTDAIRPASWIVRTNPELRWRAVFGGNLRASLLACLKASPAAGRSESALAAACGATRKALRDALDHLQLCGLISRERSARRTVISISDAVHVA